MSETLKHKKLDLSAIMEGLRQETARDIVGLLLDNDQEAWMSIMMDFPHPPSAIMKIAKIAGSPFPYKTAEFPTEQEKLFFMTGNLPPTKRAMEVALFILNDPIALRQFEAFSRDIVESREKMIVENQVAITKAQIAAQAAKAKKS